MTHGYAQTILQLFAQLQKLGYSQAELERVRRAADLANLVFGPLVRGSGKPFSAHLVGTASILARYGASAPLVLSSLLHAAYSEGQWDDGASGVTPERRAAVRRVLGEEAEEFVYRYTCFSWRQTGAVAAHAKAFRDGGSIDRDMILMRLANELEEYLDLGNLYAPDAERRMMFPDIYGDDMVALAHAVHVPGLADELAAAFAADRSTQVSPSLRASAGGSIQAPIADSGAPRKTFADHDCLLDFVVAHASERPTSTAIDNGGKRTSWAALLPRVAGLADAIRATAGSDEPVAALVSQANMPLAFLAALAAGRIFAPVATDYPAERRRRIFESLKPGCIVTDDETLELAKEATGELVNVDQTGAADPPPSVPIHERDMNAPALVIFTSGSTGEPLGVVHSENALLRLARRSVRAMQISADDRLSLLSGGVHISGITDMIRSFVSGASLVLCDVARLGVDALADSVQQGGVTLLHCTPSLAATVFRSVPDPNKFRTVRLLHLGGESLRTETAQLCRTHLPDEAVIVNQLGCTELSGFCQAFLTADVDLRGDMVPSGRPSDGVSVRLLDRSGNPVGAGAIGVIELAGDGLALGYWNAPEFTSGTFHDGGPDEPRRFLTGDRGRWLPDGQLEHCGRVDDQLQVHGFRVEPAEAELALLGLDDVLDAAVLVDTQEKGARLIAHVVPASSSVTADALKASLGRMLPSYMQPNEIALHESFPRTSSGKLDRVALSALVPDFYGDETRENSPAPVRGAGLGGSETLADAIALIWKEFLPVSSVGPNNNFFEMGGDSLLAMRAVSAVAAQFEVGVDLRDLFDAPTPQQFAERVAAARAKHAQALTGNATVLEMLISEIEGMSAEDVRRALDP